MSNPITALANIKRWQAKLKPTHPYVDDAPFTVPIFQAMFEGRPVQLVADSRTIAAIDEEAKEKARGIAPLPPR